MEWNRLQSAGSLEALAPSLSEFRALGALSLTMAGTFLRLQDRLEEARENLKDEASARRASATIKGIMLRAGERAMEAFMGNDEGALRQIADVVKSRVNGSPLPGVKVRRAGLRKRADSARNLMPAAIANVVRRHLPEYSGRGQLTIKRITVREIREELDSVASGVISRSRHRATPLH